MYGRGVPREKSSENPPAPGGQEGWTLLPACPVGVMKVGVVESGTFLVVGLKQLEGLSSARGSGTLSDGVCVLLPGLESTDLNTSTRGPLRYVLESSKNTS